MTTQANKAWPFAVGRWCQALLRLPPSHGPGGRAGGHADGSRTPGASSAGRAPQNSPKHARNVTEKIRASDNFRDVLLRANWRAGEMWQKFKADDIKGVGEKAPAFTITEGNAAAGVTYGVAAGRTLTRRENYLARRNAIEKPKKVHSVESVDCPISDQSHQTILNQRACGKCLCTGSLWRVFARYFRFFHT